MRRKRVPSYGRRQSRGYAGLAVIIALMLIAIAMTVAVPDVKTQSQRERDIEFQFRGDQMAEAIARYYSSGRLPPAGLKPVDRNALIPEVMQLYHHENAAVPVGLSLDPHAIAAFLLRLALAAQPTGPVLAGTTRPEHAREFGGVVPLEPGQVAEAQAIVSTALERSPA